MDRDYDRYREESDSKYNRDQERLRRTLERAKERGYDVHETSSGHYETSRSTILPDGTEIVDL